MWENKYPGIENYLISAHNIMSQLFIRFYILSVYVDQMSDQPLIDAPIIAKH